jgi:hypothetical protein
MRRCIVTGLSLGTLVLASSGLASTGLPSPAVGSARLSLTALHPLTVRGSAFQPGERVQLVLLAQGRRFVISRTANSLGSFTGRFARDVFADRCAGYSVEGVGSLGSKAVYRSPLLFCSTA